MQTARGCSHRCRFCNVHSLYGAGYRAKAEWQIERELRAIEGVSQTKRLYVTDDNIVSREDHFEGLMKAFSETQYTWYANADISFGLDRTKIKRAYQSGLRQVLIGLESVNPKVLYTLNPDQYKYRQRDLYLQAIQAIQAEGIGVTGSFIVGHENDGEEQFYQLETFIRESNLYAANITFLTPYPGTPLFQSMKRRGQILTYNWEYYTIFQPVLKVRGATTQQLNGWYLSLLDHIYSVDCANEKARYFADVYRKRRASG
ncbi:MAG: B12-binding domain-containing radical SAM protein [Clostridia bacterium]